MKMEEYISNFRREMQNLGYVEDEVEAFVHDIVDDRIFNNLSQDEYNEMIDNFKDFLMFARKCKGVH